MHGSKEDLIAEGVLTLEVQTALQKAIKLQLKIDGLNSIKLNMGYQITPDAAKSSNSDSL